MSKYVFTSVNGCGYTISMEGIRYIHNVSDFEIDIHYNDGYILPLIFNDETGENSAIDYLNADNTVELFNQDDIDDVLRERCEKVFKIISDALIGGE